MSGSLSINVATSHGPFLPVRPAEDQVHLVEHTNVCRPPTREQAEFLRRLEAPRALPQAKQARS
jgi:hypothetical protein